MQHICICRKGQVCFLISNLSPPVLLCNKITTKIKWKVVFFFLSQSKQIQNYHEIATKKKNFVNLSSLDFFHHKPVRSSQTGTRH